MTPNPEPVIFEDGSIGLERDGTCDVAAVESEAIAVPTDSVDAVAWDRQSAWLAVTTVMAVAWFPYIASCLLHWAFSNDTASWPYIANSMWEIVQYLGIVAVVLFVMHCDGRPWSTFGIRPPHLFWDPLAALLILIGTYAVIGALYLLSAGVVGTEAVEQFSESSYEFAMPTTPTELLILMLLAWSISLSEELVMRGYLIPTFERLLKSTWLSVLLTSALFASYHIYQGFGPMLGIFGVGLVFGAVFCRWRQLWPLVLAHAAMDVIAALAQKY